MREITQYACEVLRERVANEPVRRERGDRSGVIGPKDLEAGLAIAAARVRSELQRRSDKAKMRNASRIAGASMAPMPNTSPRPGSGRTAN